MNPEDIFCPNIDCPARGQIGKGNIRIHSQKEKRYICDVCEQTFTATKGTIFYRLRTEPQTVLQVIALLAYGCPIQAIVRAFGLDERTVRDWWQRAGKHCQQVHEHKVEQAQLDLQQVQADEIKVKKTNGYFWMALAIMIPTRIWLGGVISPHRDLDLIQTLTDKIRKIALCRPLLLAVEGLASYVTAFRNSFRSVLPNWGGKNGRPHLVAWPNIAIVQVINQRLDKQLNITRHIVQGSEEMVHNLIRKTQGQGMINTAFIERLNATFRQLLNSLARRTRTLVRKAHTLKRRCMSSAAFTISAILITACASSCPSADSVTAGCSVPRPSPPVWLITFGPYLSYSISRYLHLVDNHLKSAADLLWPP